MGLDVVLEVVEVGSYEDVVVVPESLVVVENALVLV